MNEPSPQPPALREIGPDQARELISKASMRYVAARMDGKKVAKYTAIMLCGQWQASTTAIPVVRGYLFDGINRLMAVIVSGTTQRFLVDEADEPDVSGAPVPDWHRGPRVCDVASMLSATPLP